MLLIPGSTVWCREWLQVGSYGLYDAAACASDTSENNGAVSDGLLLGGCIAGERQNKCDVVRLRVLKEYVNENILLYFSSFLLLGIQEELVYLGGENT